MAKWQTHRTQNAAEQSVPVQVRLSAPEEQRLFSNFCVGSALFLYIIQESVRKINDEPRTKKVRKHCNAQRTGLFLITPAGRFDKTPRMVLEQYHPKIILKYFCVSANAVAVKCSYFAVIDGTLCSLPLAALWKMM